MRFVIFFRLFRKINFFEKFREKKVCFRFVLKRTQFEKNSPKNVSQEPCVLFSNEYRNIEKASSSWIQCSHLWFSLLIELPIKEETLACELQGGKTCSYREKVLKHPTNQNELHKLENLKCHNSETKTQINQSLSTKNQLQKCTSFH